MCEETKLTRKGCQWTEMEDALLQRNVKLYGKKEAFVRTSMELKRTVDACQTRWYSFVNELSRISKPEHYTKLEEPISFGKRKQLVLDIKSVAVSGNKITFEF